MIAHGNKIKLFAGNGSPALAAEIAKELNMPLGAIKVGKFSDGETSVQIDETVRGCDVFVIQSTSMPVNDNLVELLVMIDAMRRAQPDVILTHDPCDGNVDHHTVGAIVQDSIVYLPLENVRVQTPALQRQPTVFLMDTYAGVGPMPTAFVDITDQFETKRQALLCHRSQLTAETSWEEMLEVQGKFRGMQAGFRYAEAFKGFQLFDSMPDYKLLP